MDLAIAAPPEPAPSVARQTLLRRLTDVVSMPSSTISLQERSVAGDILLEMLFSTTNEERLQVAQRLQEKSEAPGRLLRYLVCCDLDIARPILEHNRGLDDGALVKTVQTGTTEHRLLVAQRKVVPQLVTEALVRKGEFLVVIELLKNPAAEIADDTLDEILSLSQGHNPICDLLINRPELTPAHALAMFWWSDTETREQILRRHSADRIELIQRCGDVFAMAAEEEWSDAVSRKILQLIERRQRNRAAIPRSPFDSLEHAIDTVFASGLDAASAQEIGYLSGIKPVTIAKILSDQGGEGIAVLCKATGLKREYLERLYLATGRDTMTDDGYPHPVWHQVRETYEFMMVAKAQTTLRYWNWSLSSTFSPRIGMLGELGDETAKDHSIAQRTANLVFGD